MVSRKITIGILVNLCRFVVALTFIFSGYVKAIDPLGTLYKLQDYLEVVHLSAYVSDYITLAVSVLLGGIEFCLGVLLLFAIRRRLVTRLLLFFMAVMTPLTLWLALDNPIGEAYQLGDFRQERGAIGSYRTAVHASARNAEVHKPLKSVDSGQLYNAVYPRVKQHEPLYFAAVRLPSVPHRGQYPEGDGNPRGG